MRNLNCIVRCTIKAKLTCSEVRFEVVGEGVAPGGIGGNSPCAGAIGGWKEPNACSCGASP